MNRILVYKSGMMISGKVVRETEKSFIFETAEGDIRRLLKKELGSLYELSKSLLQSHSFLDIPLHLEEDEITTRVFEAVEEQKPMPVGEWVLLEYLEEEMDGVFQDKKEWKSFLDKAHDSYDKDVMDELLKGYCTDKKEYECLFVQPIGGGRYMSVKAEDLKFSYRAETLWKKSVNNPSAVEILMMAEIK